MKKLKLNFSPQPSLFSFLSKNPFSKFEQEQLYCFRFKPVPSFHLAPFYSGATHLRPFYKYTREESFLLLDNTAREISPNKKGYMDPALDSLFDRLKIDRDQWLQAIINYDKWFYRIIGKMSAAWESLKDTTAHWFKGSKINRHLFGD